LILKQRGAGSFDNARQIVSAYCSRGNYAVYKAD